MPWTPPFSEADLRAAVAQSTSWADTLRFLGYAVKGANYRTLQRWAKRWSITTDHFNPNDGRRRASLSRMKPLEDTAVLRAARRRPAVAELPRLGRRYGVSDNAVRKWIYWYEHAPEADGETEAA
jgi:hypothetical protein